MHNLDEQLSKITTLRGIGKIIPEAEIIKLATESDGLVSAIYASENDSLSKNQPILTLNDRSESGKLEATKAKIASLRASILVSEANLHEERVTLGHLKREYERFWSLYQEGAEAIQYIENKQAGLQIQEAILSASIAQLNVVKCLLVEQEKLLLISAADLQKKTVVAPDNGILLEITVKSGDYAKSGDQIGQFAPNSPLIVTCEIDEAFAHHVKEGQRAYILNTTTNDTITAGRVFFVGKFLKNKSLFYEKQGEAEDRRVRSVKIMPDKQTTLIINQKVESLILIN